jgi:hypothetical protein
MNIKTWNEINKYVTRLPQIGVEQIEGNERGLFLFVFGSELVEKNFFNVH